MKKYILSTIVGVTSVLFLTLAGSIFETNDKGQFQIKQAAVSGTMSVRTTPGTYLQNFGDITTWNKAETFFFTADKEEGASHDESIEVRFVDGSVARISGTMRISLPKSPEAIIELIDSKGFTSYDHLENKLIRPTVRNALRLTANFMTARESYAEKRADFTTWAWDQVQNGLYKTKDTMREVLDPTTGKKTKKAFKTILKDKTGNPAYTRNPLEGTGIILSNFEIKSFVYSEKVKAQIAKQQQLYMAIATAKAEVAKSQQDKLKEKAVGEANVARAEAEALVLKKRAVVEAEKTKQVAELEASKKFEVARYAAKEALEKAKKIKAEGMAKAAANTALVRAGLTPRERAEFKMKTAIGVAEKLSQTKFPSTMIVGGSGKSISPIEIVGINQMLDLTTRINKQ